jgi:tripartite-type tricarboxylate transporter receptor subunit TctC
MRRVTRRHVLIWRGCGALHTGDPARAGQIPLAPDDLGGAVPGRRHHRPAGAHLRPKGRRSVRPVGRGREHRRRGRLDRRGQVAKAAPDGYTLLLHNVTFSTTTTSLQYTGRAKHNFDDFTPVSLAANVPLILMCHPSVPAKNLKEFVAYAKEQNKADKGVFYGTTGPGSVMHLSAETLKRDTGVKMEHVPFRGAAPLVQELLTGRIQLGGDQISTSLGHVRGGALTAIATLSPARTSPLPDLQTVREQGFPNMELFGWNGFFAPAKTPPAVVAAIQAEMAKARAIRT